jgi:hypothetical protein
VAETVGSVAWHALEKLAERGLIGVIYNRGKPAPLAAKKRSLAERTNSWHNAHKKLVRCTECEGRVIASWLAFSNAIIIVGKLLWGAWIRYRNKGRLSRRP